MFLGTYTPNLIGKNRLALPRKIRSEVKGEKIVLATGFEQCILGFEEKAWEQAISPELSRPISDKEGRRLRREMCSKAEVVNLDSQGRFVIPEVLLDYAGIKQNIVIVGAGDHFEIWNKEKWGKYSQLFAK